MRTWKNNIKIGVKKIGHKNVDLKMDTLKCL